MVAGALAQRKLKSLRLQGATSSTLELVMTPSSERARGGATVRRLRMKPGVPSSEGGLRIF